MSENNTYYAIRVDHSNSLVYIDVLPPELVASIPPKVLANTYPCEALTDDIHMAFYTALALAHVLEYEIATHKDIVFKRATISVIVDDDTAEVAVLVPSADVPGIGGFHGKN